MIKTVMAVSTVVSITLASSFLNDANAASRYSYYSTEISVNGDTISKPGHIIAQDQLSDSATSFLPMWYIDAALQQLGITSKWDGENLSLSVPSGMHINYPQTPSQATLSKTVMAIEVNGRVVTYAPRILYYDEENQSAQTTFVPIFYFETALKCLGLAVTWDGTNLSISDQSTQGKWTKMKGVNDTESMVVVNGTLYAAQEFGNHVWEYQNGTWSEMRDSPARVTSMVNVNGTLYTVGGLSGHIQVSTYENGKWSQIINPPVPLGDDITNLWYLNGTLYAGGGYDSSVWAYANGNWVQYSIPADGLFANNDNVDGLENIDGTLYASLFFDGVWAYTNGTWTKTTGSVLTDPKTNSIETLANVSGTLYGGGPGVGVWVYRNGTWSQIAGTQNLDVFAMLNVDSTLYIAGDAVWTYSNGEFSTIGLPDDNNEPPVRTLVVANGTLYAGTADENDDGSGHVWAYNLY